MQVQTVQNQYNFNGQVYRIGIPVISEQMDLAIRYINNMNKFKKSKANIYIVPENQNVISKNKNVVYVYATTNKIPVDKLPLLTYWDMTKYGEKANSNNRDSIIEASKRTLRRYRAHNHYNEFVQKK